MSDRLPLRLTLCLVLALLLASCQSVSDRANAVPARSLSQSLPARCADDIRAFREQVRAEGVTHAGTPALALFPLLHGNRFLYAVSGAANSPAQIEEWAKLASDLAIQTRSSENRNLGAPWSERALADLAECSSVFASSPEYREERAATVEAVRQTGFPQNYSPGRQALGALPLLRPFLRPRILAEHARERALFEDDAHFARSALYGPANAGAHGGDAASWLRAAYGSSSLGLPQLPEMQLASLFARHAPNLQIEAEDANDRIGAPRWQDGAVRIDVDRPVVYTQASMTRFEGRNLLQLNYAFWFPERKPVAAIDLYAGAIDGIVWRVTLDEDGRVLLYDSIHSCGCYHKYFMVSDELAVRAQPGSREPANIFALDAGVIQDALTLRITANEHYIAGVDAGAGEARGETEQLSYRHTDYAQLQNLAWRSGSRSLFDSQGLIAGSERLERFTLWPTGILSVGAMRQWGTHATGFIEEQHFDDGTLFEYYFESAPQSR